MNRLKALLDQNEVEYTEKRFNTSAGIKGLGPNPFVSSDKATCIVRNYNRKDVIYFTMIIIAIRAVRYKFYLNCSILNASRGLEQDNSSYNY